MLESEQNTCSVIFWRNNPMSGFDTLLNRFRTPPSPSLYIRPDLMTAIQGIAQQDNCSIGTVINDLLSFALAERHSSNASLVMWQQLTPREKEVVALVWLGQTNPQIAAQLVVSVYTVRAHMRSILSKFDVHSKEDLRAILSSLDFSEWVEGRMKDEG